MLLTQEYQDVWGFTRKAIFKFIFVYFSLYIFLMFFSALVEAPTRWFGSLLGIDYAYDVSGFGSGDHTFAYATLFMNVILAIIITLLWIVLDRTRNSYNQLMYWFIVILRAYLIFFMFTYGFVKVIQLQFSYPSLTRMLEPLGNFSPMGLAWTYLGYSKGFNLFMGIMEISGGLLLIPRRTSTLGGFITMGVMMHVAVMNFMYDIPVKIFSVHLTLIALFIFSTDIKRFINVFIKNKPTEAYDYYNPIKDKTYHKVIFWMKLFFVIALSGLFLLQGWGNDRGKNMSEKPPLYGIWETSYFLKNNDTLPPLVTDTERWRYLIIDAKNRAIIKTMDDVKHQFTFKPDTTNNKILMHKRDSNSDTTYFHYSKPNSVFLEMNGIMDGDSLKIIFSLKDINDFRLHSRGFNWINERPFNR